MHAEIRDMVCAYGGVAALKGISLGGPRPNKLVALIGANGAEQEHDASGDLRRLVPPSSGTLFFDGKDMDSTGAKPPRVLASGIAHCPEGRRVFPHMTVEENLNMGAHVSAHRRAGSRNRPRPGSILDLPRLAERRLQAAGTLSGGEQADACDRTGAR